MPVAHDYDRTLISLALAVLGAAMLSGTAHAQVEAQVEPMMDRYGGMSSEPLAPAPTLRAAPAPAQAPPVALRGSFDAPRPMAGGGLSWAGKSYTAPTPAASDLGRPLSALAPVSVRPPLRRDRRAMRDRPAAASSAYQTRFQAQAGYGQGAPPQADPSRYARSSAAVQGSPAAQQRPLLTSIYAPRPTPVAQAPAPRAPTPYRSAQGYEGGTVRHYSVHREFGIRPDPTPIPPQFFTATADLSAGDADAQPLARNTPAAIAAGRSTRARAAAAATTTDPS